VPSQRQRETADVGHHFTCFCVGNNTSARWYQWWWWWWWWWWWRRQWDDKTESNLVNHFSVLLL